MYYLFYGDKIGSLGMELLFFEILLVGRIYCGMNVIIWIGLFVFLEDSLYYWKECFEKFDVKYSEMIIYVNCFVL